MKKLNFEFFIAPLCFAIIPSVLMFNYISFTRIEIGFLKFWINITWDKNTDSNNPFSQKYNHG